MTLLLTTALSAAVPTAYEVMKNVADRPTGEDMKADLSMEIMNSKGKVREREIVQIRQDDGDMEKKLMFFTAPSDVKDTGFLSISYDGERDDDQWIYLPALKRVKRIASSNKNDSFMGSDFTYDDMGTRSPDKDTHTMLGTENVGGFECYVVESIPKTSNKEFDRTVSYVVKDEWFGMKKEYYNEGEKVRELTINEFEKIDGIYVITDMVMKNLDKGTQTRILMDNVTFNNDFDPDLFSERQLKIGPRF